MAQVPSHAMKRALGAVLTVVLAMGTIPAASSADTVSRTTGIEDGVYAIEGKLLQATGSNASMADAAFSDIRVQVKGGSARLVASLGQISSAGLKAHLGRIAYFPDLHGSTPPGSDDEARAVSNLQYWDADDAYNAVTGSDLVMRGTKYPRQVAFDIDISQSVHWLQVYIPLMEELSAGSGTQNLRLVLDLGSMTRLAEELPSGAIADSVAYGKLAASICRADAALKQGSSYGSAKVSDLRMRRNAAQALLDARSAADAEASSSAAELDAAVAALSGKGSSKKKGSAGTKKAVVKKKAGGKLDFSKLADGSYTVRGTLLKTDKSSVSMGNAGIDPSINLRVKGAAYTLTVSFKKLSFSGKSSYLGALRYYKSGYRAPAGVPAGATAAASVLSYVTTSEGKRYGDAYGDAYPARVSFPLIAEAKKSGCVPVEVEVPIMESIAKGNGTQKAYLKLDTASVVAGKKSFAPSSGASAQGSSGSSSAQGASADGSSLGESVDFAVAEDGADAVEAAGAEPAADALPGASVPAADEGKQPPLKRYIPIFIAVPAALCLLALGSLLLKRWGRRTS